MNKATLTLIYLIVGLSSSISIIFLFRQSIRLDEAQSIWLFSKSVLELLKLSSQDVNLPLYGLILHFWMQIFGTDIVLVRLPSLIFFWLTIGPLYKLAKESSNKEIALLTVAIFCFSPFIVWFTSEARTYTLFTLVTTINNLFYLRLLKQKNIENKFGYFLSILAGLYTHYFFIFLLFSQSVYLLVLRLKNKRKNNIGNFFWGVNLLAFLFFIPWLIYVFKEGVAANTQPLITPPTSYNIVQTLVNFTTGFQPQTIQSLMISMWPLTTVVLFFVFTHKKRGSSKNLDYFFLISFLPIVVVFLISFIKPIFLSRYLILVTPTLFFIIAWIILNNSKKVSYVLAVMVSVVLIGLSVFQSLSNQIPIKENYRGITEYLNNYLTNDDVVAISSPFTIYPVEYQYQGRARLDTIPQWNRYTEGAIPNFNLDNLEKQVEEYKNSYNRLCLVLSYDQGYENEIVNYLDTHYALMGTGKFSEDIELRIYKLRY